MTLKKKILIGYGVAFALMGLVVAWAVINLVSLGRATDAILSENYRSILAAENMVDALERQDSGILLMFLGDAGERDQPVPGKRGGLSRVAGPGQGQHHDCRRRGTASNPSRPITPPIDVSFPR